MFGVSADITRRKQAELDLQKQRNELAHLSRMTMLGELSGTLAHELNQPLAAILSNAEVALGFLAQDATALDKVREILEDIIEDDIRAGEVIQRLRLLLRKNEVQRQPLNLNEVVQEVLKLVRSDLASRNIAVNTDLSSKLPAVIGDRVLLQQVLLNLILNGCDAMAHAELVEHRRLHIQTHGTATLFKCQSSTKAEALHSMTWSTSLSHFFPPSRKVWDWDSPSAAPSSMPIMGRFGPQITPIAARAFISRYPRIRENLHERPGAYRFYSR